MEIKDKIRRRKTKQFQVKKGKPTQKPTMRWMFFSFQGITELNTKKEGKIEYQALNLKEVHWKILNLMGE
jgi:hypothetical protein